MTWTLTVDGRTATLTDTEAIFVQKQLDRVGSAGYHFDLTSDDGTELRVTLGSSVTLMRDG